MGGNGMKNKIKAYFTKGLISSALDYKKHFDPVTGRFMEYVVMTPDGRRQPQENLGWAITQQDPILAYAYLYKTEFPDNPFYQDSETLVMICKAVQAWRDFQYPDGQMEFIKVNGECWGPIYMPWSWYFWLETYIMLADVLPEETKADWRTGMFPGFESYAKQDPEHVHNIPVWQAMTVHRAGQYFGRQDWIDGGDALIANTCKAQHPDGFWAEHKGPTIGYNAVYMFALGMYFAHGGKVDVLPAIRRGTEYMQMFTYPSGAGVDTIDGRQHYHAVKPGEKGGDSTFPAYAATTGGLAFVEAHLSDYSQTKINMQHTTAFMLALDLVDESRRDVFAGLSGFDGRDFVASYGSATVVRKNNRQITLSAYTAPLTTSRWGMDRQALASVWTEDADLLMGSANSKNHIELSTFVIGDVNGKVLSYIPTTGKVVKDGIVSLDYDGYADCTIEGSICDCGKIKLTYSAKLADPAYQWRIGLPLFADFDVKKSAYTVSNLDGKNCIEYKGWRVSFAGNYKIVSPIRPFNPYVKDGSCDMEHYLLAVNVYPSGKRLEVTFEKIDEKEKAFFDDLFIYENQISEG